MGSAVQNPRVVTEYLGKERRVASFVEVGGPYAAHRISPQCCNNSPVLTKLLALSPKNSGSQVQCYGPPATDMITHNTESITPLDTSCCTLQ